MSKKTVRDEIEDALELLTKRLARIQREIQQQSEDCDPRLLGLFKGEVSDVIADLERYRAETAAAISKANTGYSASRAYLSVGKLASSSNEPAEILSFDKNRNKSHAR